MDSLFTQMGYAMVLAVRDAVTFPWWWYTAGMRGMFRWAGRTLRGWEHAVGLRLWAKNLTVPMFGQTDWQGRLISFAMRCLILIGRTVQVLVGALVVLGVLLAYVTLPIGSIGLIVRGFVR